MCVSVFHLLYLPSVNVVNIGGDYEIGRSVCRSVYASVVLCLCVQHIL